GCGLCMGLGHDKCLILKELSAYFGLKKGLCRPFRGQKGRYRKKHMTGFFSFARRAESYNALFDAKKGDIGPENAYNWIDFADFSTG
ncbi:hypothetical protein QUF72_18915, partial [Desulfobacterales bacterium HSG2]|nr:hypothetical protein [Desulfobacterales bacterium HSG2]